MPFNGSGDHNTHLPWDHFRILEAIREDFPGIQKVPDPANSTAYHYRIPGHKGNVGIIAAYTRSFCGSCNRLRLTPQGVLKTCLYGDGVLNVRDLMRAGTGEAVLQQTLTKAIGSREKDGWEAEKNAAAISSLSASMATIGG